MMHSAHIPPRAVLPISRRDVVSGGLALTTAGFMLSTRAARAGPGGLAYTGVNLAGAEFGTIPGTYARDYAYPPHELIDYFSEAGFNLIRVPFAWERLQPGPGKDLAAEELAHLTALVNYAANKRIHIVLDAHNYAHRRLATDGWSIEHKLGSSAVSPSTLSDLWSRLAALFKENDRVIFGLMNEPKDLPSSAWLPMANAAVAAIRAAGARNLVLVPGVAYTGAHSWIAAKNTEMIGIVDPGGNFAFEVHQYFDGDSSGTSPQAVSSRIGSQRIQQFQNWARKNGVRAFLGEFGAAADPQSLMALRDLCSVMEANSDVWLGWAAWAGGSWWPDDYMFNLNPHKDGAMRAQTKILSEFARRG
jgi:endoglucanase